MAESEHARTDIIRCPSCDAGLRFDPESGRMACDYCESRFDIEELKNLAEQSAKANAEQAEANWQSGSQMGWTDEEKARLAAFICSSCGAEIVCDATTAATKCAYCGNPTIMPAQLSNVYRPSYLVPFKIGKDRAVKEYKALLRKTRLVPKPFRAQEHIEDITGVYVPFWLFEADTEAYAQYDARKVSTWSDSRYMYTRTEYYVVTRGGRLAFKGIPADGSQKMPDDLMESVEPFDLRQAVPFRMDYLSGFSAEKYDVEAQVMFPRVNARIRESCSNALQSTVTGYSSVAPKSVNVSYHGSNVHYALLPVWMLNTAWKGQRYTFAVNGQTGEAIGNMPMDKGAFVRWWLIWGAVIGAVIFVLHLLSLFL